MPALLLAREACERSGIDEVTVITCKPEPFFDDYIRLVFTGFGRVEIVALHGSEYVTTSRALYATSLGEGVVRCVLSEHGRLVSRLKSKIGMSERQPSRDIYISRGDTRTRPMENEAALIESLSRRGLEIVTLSGMSVADQIKLFDEARLIVGPHGAGLANIVFARSGTTLLELGQTEYVNACFLRLAQAVGVRHVMQFFDSRNAVSIAEKAWQVDIDAVGAAVDRILAAEPA